MVQAEFDFNPPPPAPPAPPPTKREAFEGFVSKYPEVYELFKFYALELLRAGRTRYSARTIIERVRWQQAVNSVDDEGYKINNNHIPYFARRLIDEDQRFEELFATRELTSE